MYCLVGGSESKRPEPETPQGVLQAVRSGRPPRAVHDAPHRVGVLAQGPTERGGGVLPAMHRQQLLHEGRLFLADVRRGGQGGEGVEGIPRLRCEDGKKGGGDAGSYQRAGCLQTLPVVP